MNGSSLSAPRPEAAESLACDASGTMGRAPGHCNGPDTAVAGARRRLYHNQILNIRCKKAGFAGQEA
jgi:hypothetical protein